MDTIEQKSTWDKTQAELTAGEQVKVAVTATVLVTVASVAITGLIYGGVLAWEAYKVRKAEKALEKNSEK